MGCSIDKPNKIEGFDKWDVEDAARTMIKAKEYEHGDQKFLKVVLKEVKKQADAAVRAATMKDQAAKELKLHEKVGKKMKKVFGGKNAK